MALVQVSGFPVTFLQRLLPVSKGDFLHSISHAFRLWKWPMYVVPFGTTRPSLSSFSFKPFLVSPPCSLPLFLHLHSHFLTFPTHTLSHSLPQRSPFFLQSVFQHTVTHSRDWTKPIISTQPICHLIRCLNAALFFSNPCFNTRPCIPND